jgi:hypothetical protein
MTGREYDDNSGYGNESHELNKGDIVYAVRKFLNDADAYAEHGEYKQIKHVMNTFLEYIEEL